MTSILECVCLIGWVHFEVIGWVGDHVTSNCGVDVVREVEVPDVDDQLLLIFHSRVPQLTCIWSKWVGEADNQLIVALWEI